MKKLLFILCALLCLSIGYLASADDAHAGGGGKGGSAPSVPAAPAPPPPAPIPDTTPQEAVSRDVRDEERRKLRQQKGIGGTVLAPLGQLGAGGNQAASNTLLGRIGQ